MRSFFLHFWGHLGGKGDRRLGICERSASVACWLRGVGGAGAPKLDCRWPKCQKNGFVCQKGSEVGGQAY